MQYTQQAAAVTAEVNKAVQGKQQTVNTIWMAMLAGGHVLIEDIPGVGKTTLFRLIMGIEKPLHGTFSVGETVKLAYVDQQHASIDPEKTVYQVISQDSELIQLGGRSINARAYVSRFNFSGADQEKKCGVLSGGERNRLHLALALKEEGNVLLLDEPTNHVDRPTRERIIAALRSYDGIGILVSHDVALIDAVASSCAMTSPSICSPSSTEPPRLR